MALCSNFVVGVDVPVLPTFWVRLGVEMVYFSNLVFGLRWSVVPTLE